MLDQNELRVLSAWCASRAIRWRPLSPAASLAVLLEPAELRQCWDRMVLTQPDDDFELATESGEKLASASDLNSVLDALEAGVAGPAASFARSAPAFYERAPAYVV